jgi:hypothetical protein
MQPIMIAEQLFDETRSEMYVRRGDGHRRAYAGFRRLLVRRLVHLADPPLHVGFNPHKDCAICGGKEIRVSADWTACELREQFSALGKPMGTGAHVPVPVHQQSRRALCACADMEQ